MRERHLKYISWVELNYLKITLINTPLLPLFLIRTCQLVDLGISASPSVACHQLSALAVFWIGISESGCGSARWKTGGKT